PVLVLVQYVELAGRGRAVAMDVGLADVRLPLLEARRIVGAHRCRNAPGRGVAVLAGGAHRRARVGAADVEALAADARVDRAVEAVVAVRGARAPSRARRAARGGRGAAGGSGGGRAGGRGRDADPGRAGGRARAAGARSGAAGWEEHVVA